MNGTHGIDATLDLVYVLYLPADHAANVLIELLRHGIPENRIKTVDPAGDSARPTAATGPRRPGAGPPAAKERAAETRNGRNGKPGTDEPAVGATARGRRGDRDGRGDASPRHAEAVRFLPRSVRLGTFDGGRYNVVMRRRAVPEERETVWISMAAAAVAAEHPVGTEANDEAREAAREATDRPDPRRIERLQGGGDDGSVTIARCCCSSTECDGYKEVLRRYFVDRDFGGHGHAEDLVDAAADGYNGTRCPHQAVAAARCVYKKIADVLLQQNEGADDGTTAKGGRYAAAADTAAGGEVNESSSDAPPSVARKVDVHNDDVCDKDDDDVCDEGDDDDDDDDEGDGNSDDLTEIASSQQVSAVHRPSSASSDRPTVASPALDRPTVVSPARDRRTVASPALNRRTIVSPARDRRTVMSPARDRRTVVSPARDRRTVASPARVRTAAARPRGGDAQQVTAKKPTFIDKLLGRNKRTAVEIKIYADRSRGFRKLEKKKR